MSTSISPQTYDPADIPVVILCGGMGTGCGKPARSCPRSSTSAVADLVARHEDLQPLRLPALRAVLGYKGEQIRRYFLDYREQSSDFTLDLAADQPPRWHGTGVAEDWEVTFVETGLLTGTGGRIRRVASHLDRDFFLLTYGDGIGAVDIEALVAQHLAGGQLATVTGCT
jgi:glucose-1-phosphate cytidylyltransferase